MMEDRIRWLHMGLIALLLSGDQCSGQGKTRIVNHAGGNKDNGFDPRLGLVATQLGLSPVAGYNEGGSPPINIPPQEYLPTGGAPAIGYSAQLSPSSQCECVPVQKCPSYKGEQHDAIADGSGIYGGLQSGGGGAAPNKDGSGLLDLRIVNRPTGQGAVQCRNGEVFCCDSGNTGGDVPPPYHGAGGSGGYATCGSRNIIDVPGQPLQYGDAKFGSYPWMGVILGKENNYVGGGALISPYYVLTAAHKLKTWRPGTSMKVRLGEWNAKDDSEPYKKEEIEIENVITHPRFNPQNLENDIALVKLRSAVDLQSHPHIKAACLPQKGYQYTGQRCWVAGFGKDAFGGGRHQYIMKEVDLPILESNDCQRRFRTTRLGQGFRLNKHSFLCAGGEEGKDSCSGDGGSPLVCNTGKGGGWEVVGLVAWGVGCADYGIPGAYVNVPNYLDWINQEIYKY